MENWTIRDIEAISETTVAKMAEEKLCIKEHDVYLVDFKGYFGYSAVVFYDGHHIHHANDYQLHHNGRKKDWLRNWYIKSLNHKLYTEKEMETVTDYDDFKAKEYFLQNCYSLRRDYISIWFHYGDEEERTKRHKATEKMYYDEISFAYYYDKDFVLHHMELFKTLYKAKEKKDEDLDYWVEAFKYEMYNHEYIINWSADSDTLSAFGVRDFDELNATQRTAYAIAKRKYYEENKEAM